MRFRSKAIALSAVGAVLIGLYLLGGVLSPESSARRTAERLLFLSLRETRVSRIELRGASVIVLARKSGAWVLEDSDRELPASQGRVDELVREVASLVRGTLVTRSAAAASSLGLDGQGSGSIRLLDADGRTIASLITGKPGPRGQGLYLRVSTSPEVWLTGETLSPYLVTDRRFWANLRVLPMDVTDDMVMRLSVEGNLGHPFAWTVAREKDPRYGGEWTAVQGMAGKIQQGRVGAIVSSLTGLVGVDFAPADSRERTVSHPVARVTVSLVDNRTFILLFGRPTADGDYPCAVAGGDLCWLVPGWREGELVVAPETLTAGSR